MGIFDSIFGGGGSSNKNTSNTTVTPWEPQGKKLKVGYDQATSIYDDQKADPYAGMGATSQQALSGIEGIAGSENPFLGTAGDTVNAVGSGQMSIGTGGMFGDIYGQSQEQDFLSQGMFGDVSSGAMVNSNPYRQQALQSSLDDVENRIKAAYSGAGRYGSGRFAGAMTEGLGGVANQFNLAAYDSDMDRMMQAAGARSGAELARMGVGLNAASGQSDVEGQNIANRMGAAGMAPEMGAARYADWDRMLGVGAARDADAQGEMDARWALLNKYQNVVNTGAGGAGNTATSEPGANPALTALSTIGAGANAWNAIGGMFGGGGAGAAIGGLW